MRIRTRTFVIFFSRALNQAATIIMGIILVRMISKEALGTFRQAFLAYGFIGAFLSLQLGSSLYYFVPKIELTQRRSLLMQTCMMTWISAAITGGMLFFLAKPIARQFGDNMSLVPLIRILGVYPFAERLLLLIPGFMVSIDRPLRGGLYTLIDVVGRSCAMVTVFSLGGNLVQAMWISVASTIVVALIAFLDMVRLSGEGTWHLDQSLLLRQAIRLQTSLP